MKNGLLIHYLIGISAFLLAVTAVYFIQQNQANLISAGIISFAGLMIAITQYLIIKKKK